MRRIKIEVLPLRPHVRGVAAAARAAGVSQSHLSRMLIGERKPSAGLVKRLRRFGIEVGGAA